MGDGNVMHIKGCCRGAYAPGRFRQDGICPRSRLKRGCQNL